MKSLLKNLLVVSCVLVAFSACKHGRLWFSGSSSDTLCVDTFKYSKTDSTAGRLIKVEIEERERGVVDTYQHKQECRPDRYDGRPESGGLPRKTDF